MAEGTKFLPHLSEAEMLEMLNTERVGRIGLNDGVQPYVVPTDFGYEDGYIYIHSPAVGKKTALALRNTHACFEVDRYNADVTDYRSIIIRGPISEVPDDEGKIKAMRLIGAKARASASPVWMNKTARPSMKSIKVFRIKIEEMTGVKAPEKGHP